MTARAAARCAGVISFPRYALDLFCLVLVDGAGQLENQLGRRVGDMAGTVQRPIDELPEYLRECWHGQLAHGDRGEAGSDGQLVQFGVSFLLSLFLATPAGPLV
jgi:hypothetical protein